MTNNAFILSSHRERGNTFEKERTEEAEAR